MIPYDGLGKYTVHHTSNPSNSTRGNSQSNLGQCEEKLQETEFQA